VSEPQRDVQVIRRATAQLRHAYAQLLRSAVIDQASFAENLLSPEIKRLERLADRMEGRPDAQKAGV
jgi:hypothetical protein